MDALMQRCTDLLEVCEWRSQFSYTLACDEGGAGADSASAAAAATTTTTDDEEDEDVKKTNMEATLLPTAFGGSRAQDVYARLVKTRRSFAEQMKVLKAYRMCSRTTRMCSLY
jgi:hypothetical protein